VASPALGGGGCVARTAGLASAPAKPMTKPMTRACLLSFLLLLAACAGARRDWPTVSFGTDLKTFDAEAAAKGVALAPLPTLSTAEREGIEAPETYLAALAADFSDLKTRLQKRLDAFRAAEAAFAAAEGTPEDLKLGAELELSTLSLTVEELPAVRARAALAAAAGDGMPEAGQLAREAGDLELAFRSIIADAKLPLRAPSAS
jgi:hypothetical protein